ncbi:MAG: SlyX family protein [Ghiorsea sp.]|nr:SlyX family protein [Ghiorsea sp.]
MEALEIKISYQEHLIQELNEVVVRQQSQMDKLEKSIHQIREYLRAGETHQNTQEVESPPPHY